jgi:transaldolase
MSPLRLYADTADRDEIRSLLGSRIIHGVTTNPTILRRSRLSLADAPGLYREWEELGAREIFFQALGETEDTLLNTAREIAELGERVIVKVPATRPGFAVGAKLAAEGTRVLVTAVYSVAQAAIACATGATYVAPYLGRLDDSGRDGIEEIATMIQILKDTDTQVLVASVRSPQALVALTIRGARHVTAAPHVITDAICHPDTVRAVSAFEEDGRALRRVD